MIGTRRDPFDTTPEDDAIEAGRPLMGAKLAMAHGSDAQRDRLRRAIARKPLARRAEMRAAVDLAEAVASRRAASADRKPNP